MKRINIFFSFIFVLFFYGCEQTEINKQIKDFEIRNGIIHFKNSETFYKTADLLDKMKTEELENWLFENKFYNSMYFKFKEMNECGEKTSEDRSLTPEYIHDKVFTALLNDKGIIFVGDTISYATKDFEYIITDGDYSTIEKINKKPDAEFKNVIKNSPISNLKASSNWRTWHIYFDANHVIEVELWVEIWFYRHTASYVVDLVHNNGLNRHQMSHCYISAVGDVYTTVFETNYVDPYINFDIYNTGTNCNVVQSTFYSLNNRIGKTCIGSFNAYIDITDANNNRVTTDRLFLGGVCNDNI